MEEMRPLPPDLKEEAHLIELESMGFTIVSVAPEPPAGLAIGVASH